MDKYHDALRTGALITRGSRPPIPDPKKLTDEHLAQLHGEISSEHQRQVWLPPDQFKLGQVKRMERQMAKLQEEATSRGLDRLAEAGPPPSAVFR